MVKVFFYGTARVNFKDKMIEVEASKVSTLLKIIARKYNAKVKEIKQHLIFVNEVNIVNLKKFNTPLNDGDVIYLLSPASGG